MGMKATRHNGRAGKFGAYNVKHNDRNFDVSNSEHIDAERTKGNIYWDCYQGYCLPGMEDNRKYTFSEIEKEFYYENYHEFVEGQNRRNREASMMVYMEKYNPSYAIRISTRNFGMAKGIKSVPLYSVFCI